MKKKGMKKKGHPPEPEKKRFWTRKKKVSGPPRPQNDTPGGPKKSEKSTPQKPPKSIFSGPSGPIVHFFGPFGPYCSFLRALRGTFFTFSGPAGHIFHFFGPCGAFCQIFLPCGAYGAFFQALRGHGPGSGPLGLGPDPVVQAQDPHEKKGF